MLEQKLEDYIDLLYIRQNTGCEDEQKYHFSKKDYYEMLKPVLDIIKDNKDASILELRSKLKEKSKIEEKIKNFVEKRGMSSGLILSGATSNYEETYYIGNMEEVTIENGVIIPSLVEMKEDAIFDLASISKLFTGLSILKLVEEGIINLEDEVASYEPKFKHLKGIKIIDLLGFNVPLRTNKRIDNAIDRKEAEEILFDIHVDKDGINKDNHIPYTDMGAMVLRYVIEKATSLSAKEFIEKYLISPMGLKNTFINVPEKEYERIVSTNLDTIYKEDGTVQINIMNTKGNVYDPKARAMGHKDGIYSGHAGMFSTKDDMLKIASLLINGEYITEKLVREMAKNRSGRILSIDENNKKKYSQHLGFMCYSKHPNQSGSEVYHALSGSSFASAGWTGTQLTVDPINNISLFLGGNRAHNRISIVHPSRRNEVKTDEFGKRTILLPNGEEKIDASRFAIERDQAIIHPMLRLLFQYKMLEDFLEVKENKKSKSYRI